MDLTQPLYPMLTTVAPPNNDFEARYGATARIIRVKDPRYGVIDPLGVVDARATVLAADAAAVAVGASLFFDPGTYRFAQSTTLNSLCVMAPGALFAPDVTRDMFYNGGVRAGLYQVFAGAGNHWLGNALEKTGKVYPQWFAGANAGIKVGAAVKALATDGNGLPGAGGVVDASHFPGPVEFITTSLWQVWSYTAVGIKLIFGPVIWDYSIVSIVSSGLIVEHNNTVFRRNAAATGYMWSTQIYGDFVNATRGSPNCVVSTVPYLQVGQVMAIFGHKPRVNSGADTTTLHAVGHPAGITAVAPGVGGKLYLTSTVGQINGTGYLIVEDEMIQYNGGLQVDGTGPYVQVLARGYGGTPAVAHAVSTPVHRAVYEKYRVKSFAGANVVLDRNVDATFVAAATAMNKASGSLDIQFVGPGRYDGTFTEGVDDLNNPQAINFDHAARCSVDDRLVFENFDHGGIFARVSRDLRIRGRFRKCGQGGLALGASVWLFSNTSDCDVDIRAESGNSGCTIDDRTTSPTFYDNSCDNNRVKVRASGCADAGIVFDGGGSDNVLILETVDTCSFGLRIGGGMTQWIVAPTPNRNHFEVRATDAATAAQALIVIPTALAGYTNGRNTFVARQPGMVMIAPLGNAVLGPEGVAPLTYGPVVNTDASIADTFTVAITNAVAFQVANPTLLVVGRRYRWQLSNGSGGAHGAATWGALFRKTANPVIANTKLQLWEFVYDGTTLNQVGPTPTDV